MAASITANLGLAPMARAVPVQRAISPRAALPTALRQTAVAKSVVRRSQRTPLLVQAFSADRPSQSRVSVPAAEPPKPKGSAILHDFCMAIPYGTVALLGGLVALIAGAGAVGWAAASGGAIVCYSAAMSLKSWKARESSTAFTAMSAVVAAVLAYVSKTSLPATGPMLSQAAGHGFFYLSVAMALFLVYNILAGGNPAPSAEAAIPAAKATEEAAEPPTTAGGAAPSAA